ncbi:GntR family transcriptional regulator [Streptomyces sp. NPDC087850]|uniref:GntR family transcriptional regulator n=1 Tax=Streptomyces sp. NPDC087850 TaxID=3365809 RepID=UPI0038029EFC
MPVNPSRSQYRQAADLIRAAIEGGDHPRGEALPREDDLAEKLGVDRSTINRALRILAAEGLVQPIRAKGTIVNAIPRIRRNAVARYAREARERAGARGPFETEIRGLGMTPKTVVEVGRSVPPAGVAAILDVSADDVSTVKRARRMFADETPVQLADSYLPLELAAGTAIETENSGTGGIISRLAEIGHAQVRITEEVDVRPPTPEEANFLGLSEDHRVYAITHVGWTSEDRAVEVCLHVMPTHLWTLEYEFPADTPA